MAKIYLSTEMASHNGGFIAGTLIHTQRGLVPIESIKPGEFVLARSPGGGETSFEQVVRASVIDDQKVWTLEIFPREELVLARSEGRFVNENLFSRLVATPNVWLFAEKIGVVNLGDLPPSHFPSGEYVELKVAKGSYAPVSWKGPIIRTLDKNVGWIQGPAGDECGHFLRISNGTAAEFDFKVCDREYYGDMNDGVEWWDSKNTLRRTVYSLDVQGSCMYFAGAIGLAIYSEPVINSTFDSDAQGREST